MFLVNSRHHHFSAALPGSKGDFLTRKSAPSSEGTGLFCRVPWPEFSRAPWIIHPTHLSWFAVRSDCPILRSFSWQLGISDFADCSFVSPLGIEYADLPASPAYRLAPGIPTPGSPILLRPSIARTTRYANINAFPISYAFLPRLRGRLTLGRLPLPRKPRVYGERVFHPFYRYSCQHNHFSTVHHSFRNNFIP